MLMTAGPSNDACGAAYLRPLFFSNVPAIGWSGKDCNVGTLAHELGHILGARHNRELGQIQDYPDDNFGYGYNIVGTNAHTVMA